LVGIWQTLKTDPELVERWYEERWEEWAVGGSEAYEQIKASYNAEPNPADLLFLSRSCYGGVVRFRQRDGYMSTPCGSHRPITPASFARRVQEWSARVRDTRFLALDYREAIALAAPGDVVYCDPPYSHTQAILYGAQAFSLRELFQAIGEAKDRGVYVALSIDGTKRSGRLICDVPVPEDLFERERFINCGRSMLRRFQLAGESLEGEVVADRLLLTY